MNDKILNNVRERDNKIFNCKREKHSSTAIFAGNSTSSLVHAFCIWDSLAWQGRKTLMEKVSKVSEINVMRPGKGFKKEDVEKLLLL